MFDPREGSDPKGSPGVKPELLCAENAAEERNLCMLSQLPVLPPGQSHLGSLPSDQPKAKCKFRSL